MGPSIDSSKLYIREDSQESLYEGASYSRARELQGASESTAKGTIKWREKGEKEED